MLPVNTAEENHQKVGGCRWWVTVGAFVSKQGSSRLSPLREWLACYRDYNSFVFLVTVLTNMTSLIFFNQIKLVMFGYAGSSPLHGFSLIVVLRLLIAVAPLVVEHRLQGTRASVVATPGLWSTGSAVVVQGLNLLRGIWDLQAGFEPESPALTGEFFTTEPPGKPQYTFLCKWWFSTREGFAFSPSLLGNIWQWQETVFIVIVGSGGGVLLV